LSEAWKLSKFAYNEVAYRSIEMSRGASSGSLLPGQDPKKMFDRIVGSVKISKTAIAIFGTIGAAFPFAEYAVAPTPEALVSGISLSLAISLAYIVFFSLQILPSFSNGDTHVLLRTLPLNDRDFSMISTMSFVRTFDYIAVTTSVVQVCAVALLTHSLIATVMMAIGSAMNVIFSMSIALWFSGLFYKNIRRGGRSLSGKLLRATFMVTWGIVAMSIGFLFNLVSYILPYFTGAVLGSITQPSGLLILGLHPFSISLVIVNVVYPTLYASVPLPPKLVLLVPRFVPPLFSYLATFGYVGLALLVSKRIVLSISNITHGSESNFLREKTSEFSLKLKKPFQAYVLKDLRLASKNPSMAIFYAAPIFEIIMLSLITVQFPVMRATSMIISTVIGCFFAIMFCSTLLNTEGTGLEYTLSLPIRPRIMINAKSLLSSLAYLPAPLTLLIIGVSRHVTSDYNFLIPFVETIALVAACVFEIGFFVKPQSTRRTRSVTRAQGFSIMAGSDVRRLMEALVVSCVILFVPIMGYSISYVLIKSHPLSIMSMAVPAIAELVIVIWAVRRMAN